MRLIGNGFLVLMLLVGVLSAQEANFTYQPPVVRESVFTETLFMIERERSEYATNMAVFAGNLVSKNQAKGGSLALARRILGLALHLSPRNEKALFINRRLMEKTLPREEAGAYGAATLAELFMRRSGALLKEGGEENVLLARCLVDLASAIDPENENAVHVLELQRVEYGEVPWARFIKATGKSQESK